MRSVSSCTSVDQSAATSRMNNRVVDGGCFTLDRGIWKLHEGCEWSFDSRDPSITSCQIAISGYVFEFLAFVLCLAMLLLDYLLLRRSGSSPRVPSPA